LIPALHSHRKPSVHTESRQFTLDAQNVSTTRGYAPLGAPEVHTRRSLAIDSAQDFRSDRSDLVTQHLVHLERLRLALDLHPRKLAHSEDLAGGLITLLGDKDIRAHLLIQRLHPV